MEQYLIFLLFIIVTISLSVAMYFDVRTRKVPIKIWYPSVFIALPISMIMFGLDIWNGVINVSYTYYSYPLIYSIIMILLLGSVSHSDKYIKMGGADFIAFTIIIITSISIQIYLPVIFFIYFFIFSVFTLIITKLYLIKKKITYIEKIPLIVTIWSAYLFTVITYLLKTNFGTLPFV